MRNGFAKTMTMMAAVMSVASLVLFGFTGVALAEDRTCICYCAIPKVGATPTPDPNTKMTVTECQERCSKSDYTVAACAFDAASTPSKNVLCFSEVSCQNQGGIWDSKNQPAECMPGTKYCYPDKSDNIKAELQVAIGGQKTLEDYGEYVAIAYTWLLGSATVIAIVFIMIGGLQYAMAGGHGDTSKAKTRIKNAVVGLVLLMFTWLILWTINPNLLKLQVPQFPMIRTVELVGEGSCGYYKGMWGSKPYLKVNGAPYDSPFAEGSGDAEKAGHPYTIEDPTNGTNCGSEAMMTKDWEGNDLLDGQTCTFDYCPPKGDEQPVCVGTGDSAECLTCKEIGPSSTIQPSSSVCGQVDDAMSSEKKFDDKSNSDKHDDVYNYCFYSQDPSLFVTKTQIAAVAAAGLVAGAPAAMAVGGIITAQLINDITTGTCVSMTMDCSKMKWCGDYDDIEVFGNDHEPELDSMGDGGIFASDMTLRKICEADPCGLAPKIAYGAEENDSCAVTEGDFIYDLPGSDPKAFAWDCRNRGGIGQYEFVKIFDIAFWQTKKGCAKYDGSEISCAK